MSGKIIEVSSKAQYLDTLVSIAEVGIVSILSAKQISVEQDYASVRFYVDEKHVQATLDKIQSQLPSESESIILLLPVDAKISDREELNNESKDQVAATREELFTEISKGTECDFNFILLVILSTLVTAIGLAEDNVAVVIGAMVIAPLLGPNLGLALGAALGDKELMKSAIYTNTVGVGLTVGLAALMALVWTPNLESAELLSRTHVQMGSIVLAFAAGIAAVQSLTTRLTNLLVGVMVAVALVPPATVLGMMIGIQNWELASGAWLLLAVNIAAVNLAAQLVFILRGIRPRTWLEKRSAKEATWINTVTWVILLGVCSILVIVTTA